MTEPRLDCPDRAKSEPLASAWLPAAFEIGIVLAWILLVSGFEVTGSLAALALLAVQAWDRGGRSAP